MNGSMMRQRNTGRRLAMGLRVGGIVCLGGVSCVGMCGCGEEESGDASATKDVAPSPVAPRATDSADNGSSGSTPGTQIVIGGDGVGTGDGTVAIPSGGPTIGGAREPIEPGTWVRLSSPASRVVSLSREAFKQSRKDFVGRVPNGTKAKVLIVDSLDIGAGIPRQLAYKVDADGTVGWVLGSFVREWEEEASSPAAGG